MTDEIPQLYKAEMLVFDLAMTGLTDVQIAKQLFLSRRTVSCHIFNMRKRLKVKSKYKMIIQFTGKQITIKPKKRTLK